MRDVLDLRDAVIVELQLRQGEQALEVVYSPETTIGNNCRVSCSTKSRRRQAGGRGCAKESLRADLRFRKLTLMLVTARKAASGADGWGRAKTECERSSSGGGLSFASRPAVRTNDLALLLHLVSAGLELHQGRKHRKELHKELHYPSCVTCKHERSSLRAASTQTRQTQAVSGLPFGLQSLASIHALRTSSLITSGSLAWI